MSFPAKAQEMLLNGEEDVRMDGMTQLLQSDDKADQQAIIKKTFQEKQANQQKGFREKEEKSEIEEDAEKEEMLETKEKIEIDLFQIETSCRSKLR
jgi:hypothetical protein